MKKLPIGISSFKEIRQVYGYYVDKTRFVKKLVDNGKYYFLARPQRFGKSLFIDTLKQAFLGEKKYFTGLFLESNWDWSQDYPVVHISFGAGMVQDRQSLDIKIQEMINANKNSFEVDLQNLSLSGQFHELIQKVCEKRRQQVVILIDEYEKPILDNIARQETAAELRDGLENLYSVIKDCDAYLKFVFFTGVSKFSKVSLFSGLNNLEDITIDPQYATICGYLERDIQTVFSDCLKETNLDQLKLWYNGYNFRGKRVYNPFDILLYFRHNEFRNYWFETATPSFLIELIQARQYLIPELEDIRVSESLLNSFDVDQIELETLLFQSGYLTIADVRKVGARTVYQLAFPNLEVKMSLTDSILHYLIQNNSAKEESQAILYEALVEADVNKLQTAFHSLFASIPYHWCIKSQMAEYEGYYASIFYCCFAALGVDVKPEEPTNAGRIDLTVKLGKNIFLIEFKVISSDKEKGSALRQIKTKQYYEKYQVQSHSDYIIYLIGVEFDRKMRNIVNLEWEKLEK